MSDKNEIKVNGVSVEEPEIFGRSKTADEIKAERRAEKAAQKAAARVQRAAAREAARNQPKAVRKDMVVIACILAGVVLLCGIMLAVQFAQEKEQEKFERNESMSYIVDSSATPELSEEGIKGAVTQAYYTNGGYLCVEMVLSNGLDKPQHLESILVEISNGDTEEKIASGYTDKIAETYTIPAGGTNNYTLYIAPEHVVITDDTLEKITYTITTSGVVVE